ncbi:MAG: ABC transporter ATP-binding protein [Deinococcales bacterium]|jgi:iron(III) transport system ATP-binding protein
MATDLRIDRLRKEFQSPGGETVVAVNDVSLRIEKGSLVTLLGPSGCGKTTLLRLIAGFEEPTAGSVYFGDRRVNDEAPNVRDTAMVFQSYAIFPHLNVFENVAFGLRMKRVSGREVRRRVDHVLDLVGLGRMAARAPSQLSGGQQQRVALARCIVMEPGLLLFDEPLSNLDAKLREQMRLEIRDLQQRLGITSVYVTHDQVEAMSISDVLVVMHDGTVEQIGSPSQVYARPANRFVADFIGKVNFVKATLAAGAVTVAGVRWPVPDAPDLPDGSPVTLVLRPEAVRLSATEGPLAGTIRRTVFLGNHAEYVVSVDGVGDVLVDEPNPIDAGMRRPGDKVSLSPVSGSLHVLPATS